MDLTGQYILSSAVLASYEHCGVGWSYLLDSALDLHHCWSIAPVHVGRCNHLTLLRSLGRCIIRSLQSRYKLIIVPRLDDEVKRSPLHAFHSQSDVCIRCEKDYLHLRPHLLQLSCPVESLVASIDVRVEVHVQQDDIRTKGLHSGHQALWRRYDLHLGEVSGQEYLQGTAYALVVIDYQYLAKFHELYCFLLRSNAMFHGIVRVLSFLPVYHLLLPYQHKSVIRTRQSRTLQIPNRTGIDIKQIDCIG